jgi:glutamate-1-semialdehyde 2,1-aminomutase
MSRGKGGRITDIGGNEFVDLRMGYGPVILGRRRSRRRLRQQRGLGTTFRGPRTGQGRRAGQGADRLVEMVRLTVSGPGPQYTPCASLLYTGRTKIVKFEGQYHGVHDYALISVTPSTMEGLGDRDNPVGLAWGRGIPQAIADTIIPAPFNDLDFLRRLFERQGEEIASVIVEPVLGNAQGIQPAPGFHAGLRALTKEFGILLHYDEVKTGFRFARGGAAEYFGVTPDIATYAKAMGNGYPVAAFGGRREIMAMLPDKMSHGGTYAGNRVAAAGAVRTLELLRDTQALETISALGERIQAELRRIIEARGLPFVFTGHPTMFGIMFTDRVPFEYRDWARSDHDLYDAVAVGMQTRGVMPEPDSREPWFLCEAHATGDHLDRIVAAFEAALDAALDERAAHRPQPQLAELAHARVGEDD